MNEFDVLQMIGSASPRHLMDAQALREPFKKEFHRKPVKIWLLAAMISLFLLLVGCVAYMLTLQDFSLGHQVVTDLYDENGLSIPATEVTMDQVSFHGHLGEPVHLAEAQWLQYKEGFDPEGKLMTNDPDLPDIQNNYEYIYGCYTPEMVAELQRILSEFNLKALDKPIVIQNYQSEAFLKASHLPGFLKDTSGASHYGLSGIFYAPGNLTMSFTLVMSDQQFPATIICAAKNYLPQDGYYMIDPDTFQQWEYTTAQGAQLLLASDQKNMAYLIADTDNSIVTYQIRGAFQEHADLEAMADILSFSLDFSQIDQTLLEEALNAAEKAHQQEQEALFRTAGGFEEIMKEGLWIDYDKRSYAFYDLNKDNTQELLVAEDGQLLWWYQKSGNEIISHSVHCGKLCQDGIVELYYQSSPGNREQIESYAYFKLQYGDSPEEIHSVGKFEEQILHKDGQWYFMKNENDQTGEPISDTQAEQVRSRHPYVELDYKDAGQFPLDAEGTVLADYAEEMDQPLPAEELRKHYEATIPKILKRNSWYTHYSFADVNGDGVEDLLLSGDGELYWRAMTYRYGKIRGFGLYLDYDFVLCENGIIKHCGSEIGPRGEETKVFEFLRLGENGAITEVLNALSYHCPTDTWKDQNGNPISKEQAEEIMAQYPLSKSEMMPISQLNP